MRTLVSCLILCFSAAVHAGELSVISIDPPMNSSNIPAHSSISVTFNMPVNPVTVTTDSFWAFARWSGAVEGAITFSNNDQTITLTPDNDLSHGESVMVILSHDLQGADGSPFRSAGYSWQFMTRVRPTPMTMTQVASLTTRTVPGTTVRSYGGIASDLNNDGWLDLTMVNEDSADLRVFMHTGTSLTPYTAFLQPPSPVGPRASPSEPADFNRDGKTDICVANINSNNISILLGNGDGTYAPHQLVAVGNAPRGIAVLDVDGDGDIDIVNTNSSSNNMSILLNNGSGVFGLPAFYEGGGSTEYGLVAAEMNNDGMLDLIVGAYNSQTVIVNRNNGNATFTAMTPRACGGPVWMLASGDFNGDGNMDATTANSSSNTAGVITGDGLGGFNPATTFATEPFVIGIDAGDLDGDGDLDLATSSYSGDWRLFRNNGAGTFSFALEINAPQAASCVLPFDCDNDGDLDLGLIDELADVVILMRNSGIARPGDTNGDGVNNVTDLLNVINGWGPCPAPPTLCPADVAPPPGGDGTVGTPELLMVINNWGP